MRTLLNILWNVPGLGFVAAFFWALCGILMAITIIGLPWAKACFTLASYTLAPFGRELASRSDVTGREFDWHRRIGNPGQRALVRVRGMVAGDHACRRSLRLRDYDHRPAIRMGASEACGGRDCASWEDRGAERSGDRDRP